MSSCIKIDRRLFRIDADVVIVIRECSCALAQSELMEYVHEDCISVTVSCLTVSVRSDEAGHWSCGGVWLE